jgi:hypothetical protein
LHVSIEPFNRGHRAAGYAPDGGDTRHACTAVYPDSAAPTLALRAAAVLDRTALQLLSERVKKRDSLCVIDLNGVPVERKGNG